MSEGSRQARIAAVAVTSACAAGAAVWLLRARRRTICETPSAPKGAQPRTPPRAPPASTSHPDAEGELVAAFQARALLRERSRAFRFSSALHAVTSQDAADWTSKHGAGLSDDLRLQLYGLYKQATVGACDAPAPSRLDFVARAKWCGFMLTDGAAGAHFASCLCCRQQWQQLGQLPRRDAMAAYLLLASQLAEGQARPDGSRWQF